MSTVMYCALLVEMTLFKQRCFAHAHLHHQACNVFSFGGRTSRPLLWLQAGSAPTHYARGDGTPANQSHTSHNRQRHCTWPHTGPHDSQSFKTQRHAVPLAQMPQGAEPIPLPMAKRSTKSSRLRKQVPCPSSSFQDERLLCS